MEQRRNWRTPAVVLACGGLALTVALGIRHNFGLYLQPMTLDLGIGREAFSFAIAIQNLIYGFSQPFTGMIADKFGAARVLVGGALLYAVGLALMSVAQTSWALDLSAGLLIGIALGCTGFSIVYGAIGRAFPPEQRTTALGIAGAAGSFGQFVMLPYGQVLISNFGWHQALLILAVTVLLIVPAAVTFALPALLLVWGGLTRLSVKLPAISLGRHDFTFRSAWAATAGNFWQCLGVLVLNGAILFGGLLGLIVVASGIAQIHPMLGEAFAMLASLVLQIAFAFFNASVLASLYGFFVERRDF